MLHGRSHNVDHLDSLDEGVDGVETMNPQLLLHCLGGGGVGIVKASQLVAACLFDAFDMDLAEMTGTKDTYFQHDGKFGQR